MWFKAGTWSVTWIDPSPFTIPRYSWDKRGRPGPNIFEIPVSFIGCFVRVILSPCEPTRPENCLCPTRRTLWMKSLPLLSFKVTRPWQDAPKWFYGFGAIPVKLLSKNKLKPPSGCHMHLLWDESVSRTWCGGVSLLLWSQETWLWLYRMTLRLHSRRAARTSAWGVTEWAEDLSLG